MEQIYMIPVNEAFDACKEIGSCDCPLCKMYERLENKELDIALGPAMMEPSTRIETNEKGFCAHHFDRMLRMNNKLSLALILESHIDTVKGKLEGSFIANLFGGKSKNDLKTTKTLTESCHICDRIEYHFARMIETTVYLHSVDTKFKEKLRAQKFFCLPHYQRIVEYAKNKLDKKKFKDFYDDISEVESAYFEKILKDVSWFCKKFDYRYDSEPWYDSKDAIERAIRLLSGREGER